MSEVSFHYKLSCSNVPWPILQQWNLMLTKIVPFLCWVSLYVQLVRRSLLIIDVWFFAFPCPRATKLSVLILLICPRQTKGSTSNLFAILVWRSKSQVGTLDNQSCWTFLTFIFLFLLQHIPTNTSLKCPVGLSTPWRFSFCFIPQYVQLLHFESIFTTKYNVQFSKKSIERLVFRA